MRTADPDNGAESRRAAEPSCALAADGLGIARDRSISRRTALGGLLAIAWEARALAQAPPAGSGATLSASDALAAAGQPIAPDWPKVVKSGDATATFYLPQLDSWDGHRLETHSAVSVQTSATAQPVFGVATLVADTQVDKGARKVTLENVRIEKVRFPSAPDKEAAFKKFMDQHIPAKVRTIELDRLETALAMREAQEKGESKPFRNDPPKIVFSTTPAILVPIDGAPVYHPVTGTAYERVVNTRPLVMKEATGTHYLRLFDGWMTAPALTGPWTVPTSVRADLDPVKDWVLKSANVDLLTGADPKDPSNRPSLKKGPPP